VDFRLSDEHERLRHRCLELAADFAARSPEHDRDATHPTENYERLREEGFLALTVPAKWGGAGVGFLGHTIAFEALGQGCPSTALAFNMHASVVMPVLESPEVTTDAKRRIAELVVDQHKLIAGNFSEPGTTSLIGERPLGARARRIDCGYSISGRKMFASMLEAADYCMVMALPETAASASAGIILLVPRDAEGRRGRGQLGHARHASDAQRCADPGRLPAAGERPRLSIRRHRAVSPGVCQLVLGLLHCRLSRRCRRSL
jgi:alkylation response protein AidB-like acyl-CoA dehydrogenase